MNQGVSHWLKNEWKTEKDGMNEAINQWATEWVNDWFKNHWVKQREKGGMNEAINQQPKMSEWMIDFKKEWKKKKRRHQEIKS